MSPEQIADTAKRLKERKTELDEKNPEVAVIYAKKDIAQGSIIHDDDVEERTVHALDAGMPDDAAHRKDGVVLKKAKNNLAAGKPVCQHDLAPLVQ